MSTTPFVRAIRRVNRTSVREAIKGLQALGLVIVRQGDGATVQPLIDGSLDLLAPMIFHGGRVNADMVVDMAEVVNPLLYDMARLAIERRRPGQLDELRRLRDLIAEIGTDGGAVIAQRIDDAMRRRARAERVIEARMYAARIHQARGAELLDPAQPLHVRQVEHPRLQCAEMDVAVNRIADQHGRILALIGWEIEPPEATDAGAC